MIDLERLGGAVAALQDDDRRRLAGTERAARSFIAELRASTERRPRRTGSLWLAAALACAALGGLVVGRLTSEEPKVADTSGAVRAGTVLVAPPDRTVPLSFADSSTMELSPGGRAVVESIDALGAEVRIEEGRAEVSVRHRPGTHYTWRAGPYRVDVTGTRFSLAWVAQTERLELVLEQGSVLVSAREGDPSPLALRAPERLVIERGHRHLDSATSLPEAVAELTPSAEEVDPQPASPPTEGDPRARELDWESLGRSGRYREGYERASAIGISRLTEVSSAKNLLTLAEICRFAGHVDESVRVLGRLRERFPSGDPAAIAAFQLGRSASHPSQAARWFSTYLAERPSGSLAREASGRLLEALDRAGDRRGAEQAARRYLERYPKGPHAGFARDLLGP